MSCSIQATTRVLVTSLLSPDHRLSMSRRLWAKGIEELRMRGQGHRESGAFLLGCERVVLGRPRRVGLRWAFYDDLDPHSLDNGYVVFDGAGYGPLFHLCRDAGLMVVADVHTHPGRARQSDLDRKHPMIALQGHIALIVPDFASHLAPIERCGVYVYRGGFEWDDFSGNPARQIVRLSYI